ncbi:MAG: hypothetical protein CSA32_00070 [Desulfobulbus propionicus]|nr:MAG: hypothetical protein CSA32_00070 [Desulfobulbus propionicus]
MYILYHIILSLLFYLVAPVLFVYAFITGKHREGLRQRLGWYPLCPESTKRRIWLHAASVGEVQAARVLIAALSKQYPEAELLLTTTTIHGRKFAEQQFEGVICLLAPLDVPGIVGRAVRQLRPDVYLCLETELWPVLLQKLARGKVPTLLLNGRMSQRTVATYQRFSWLFRQILIHYQRIAVISEQDEQRFCSVGVPCQKIEVTGNLKYDRVLPDNFLEITAQYQQFLGLKGQETVFVAGSTHESEEEMLCPVFEALLQRGDALWIVAPRDLQRVASLVAMFQEKGMSVDLMSVLRKGRRRTNRIVLVDTFGDLFLLYSLGTYVFCGGSLTGDRGHNIMEPALWGKSVFYGPSMDDFRDARDMLEAAGAGFTVASAAELQKKIFYFIEHQEAYQQACDAARATADAQQGAVARQIELVNDVLAGFEAQ